MGYKYEMMFTYRIAYNIKLYYAELNSLLYEDRITDAMSIS